MLLAALVPLAIRSSLPVPLSPPITVILMAYLIGQLGGLLPLPGGIGGIDGGLIGALVVYGVPVAAATAA